jgi:hypothetical protein
MSRKVEEMKMRTVFQAFDIAQLVQISLAIRYCDLAIARSQLQFAAQEGSRCFDRLCLPR